MESMGKRPRRRRSFTPEFKAEIVELCGRGDRSIGQVAKELDLTVTVVREWVKQAGRDAGTRQDGGLTSSERAELAQLRRENRRLREDVEILKRCACRKLRPRRSGCSVVLVDDTSEAIASAYVQPGDLSRIADRFGYRTERGCLIHGLVGAVPVVVFFELPQRPQEVALIPDQGAIEEFVAQFLYPALHDRVHAGCANAGEDGRDAGVGEDLAEPGGKLGVPVPDQVGDHRTDIFEVHDQVPGELSDPVRGGVGGGAEDAHAASRVLDDSKDVLALTGQRNGLDEVAGLWGFRTRP
jgi:transposase